VESPWAGQYWAALLTSASRPPKAATVRSTRQARSSDFVTSVATPVASPFAAAIAASVLSRPSSLRVETVGGSGVHRPVPGHRIGHEWPDRDPLGAQQLGAGQVVIAPSSAM